uniref:Uncharacterized protein n=1 Tax=Megaselia scalaris TaxID=36166 RepID=T1GN46_MEGSC
MIENSFKSNYLLQFEKLYGLPDILFIFFFNTKNIHCEDNLNLNVAVKSTPRIVVVLLIRNKAHVLPYFFSYFENLDYPKDKITLWLQT